VDTELWTDKYRAKKFMDLLGDERIHRDIMRWIKHWDYCVFGRDIPKSSSYHSSYNNHNNHNNSNTGNQSGKFSSTNAKPATFGGVQAPDPYQRPQQRILMLHGPPGLGKTTLAHVAAKMAGYEVLEINASDDRSGSAARDKIVDAVETAGIDRRGRRGKERCVILDECDGGDAVSTRFFSLVSARTDVLLEFRQSSIGFDSCG
jgi:chromosome transmission fidelity protein 18